MDRRHQWFSNGTLLISKVARKDAGQYACTAANRQGTEATQKGQLKVIGELLIPENYYSLLYVHRSRMRGSDLFSSKQYFVYKPCVDNEGAEYLSKNNRNLAHGIDEQAVQ